MPNMGRLNSMDKSLINRINVLAEKSYSENRFVFTDFLDMSQLSTYYSLERDLAFVGTSGVQIGWLASQADMLADDWRIAQRYLN